MNKLILDALCIRNRKLDYITAAQNMIGTIMPFSFNLKYIFYDYPSAAYDIPYKKWTLYQT